MFMSVVDHLLCVHVPTIKVTLVYDIASEGDRPVASPMSLVCVPPSSNLQSLSTGVDTKRDTNSANIDVVDETSLYFDPYDDNESTPMWPCYYVRGSTRKSTLGLMDAISVNRDVWSLRVNLVEALRCSFGSSPGVVAGFLMRRNDDGYISEEARLLRVLEGKKEAPGTYAKSLLLSQLLSSAKQSVDLGKLVAAFNVLCRVYKIALTERTRRIGTMSSSSTTTTTTNTSKSSSTNVTLGGRNSNGKLDEKSSVLAEEHHTTAGTKSSAASNLQRRVSVASPMTTYQSVRTNGGMIVVLQRDVFKHVLQPMMMDSNIDNAWTYAVMFEYLRSLQRFHIPGKFCGIFVFFYNVQSVTTCEEKTTHAATLSWMSAYKL